MGKPSAPNPQYTANLQTQANTQAAVTSAEMGHVNQTNPYGSSTWQQTGTNADGTPQYSNTQTMSPTQQALYNSTVANQTNSANKGGAVLANWTNNGGLNFNPTLNPLTYSAGPAAQAKLGDYATSVGNGGEAVQTKLQGPDIQSLAKSSQDAAYANQMGYLNPQYSEQKSDLNSQLAAQGITQGSDAWNRAQDDLSRQQTFGQQQAESSAVNQGLTAENQLYGQELNTGQFNNAAQAQQFGEAYQNAGLQNTKAAAETGLNEFNANSDNQMSQFNAGLNNSAEAQNLNQQIQVANEPLSEYSTLENGTQPYMPNYNNNGGSQVQPTNIAGILGNNYQNQVAASNGNMQGLGSLAAIAAMFLA
jgi:hypothetical protein